MIKNIPFYSSLLGRDLANGTKSTYSHVLVYGAVEFHSSGPKGCIASNEHISSETGLTEGTVAKTLSILNKSGWVKVVLNPQNKRMRIIPLAEINLPNSALPSSKAEDWALPTGKAGPYPPVNIEPVLEPVKEIDKSISKKEEKIEYDQSSVRLSKLFYDEMSKNLGMESTRRKEPTVSDFKKMYKFTSRGVETRVVEGVILWYGQDDFWATTIHTVSGFIKHFDSIRAKAKKWQEANSKKQNYQIQGSSSTKKTIKIEEKELTPEQEKRGKLVKQLIEKGERMIDIGRKSNEELETILKKYSV